jgi:hypothetical protein
MMFAYHGKNQGERMRLTPIGVRNANSTFRKPWSFVWDAFVFKGQAITTSARHYQFFPRGLHTMPRWHTHFCNFRNTSAFPPIKLLTSPMLVEKCLQISKQVMKMRPEINTGANSWLSADENNSRRNDEVPNSFEMKIWLFCMDK